MDKVAMYIGYATSIVIALIAFLEAINKLIKWLPVTANSIRELKKREGWKIKRKMKLPC